MKEGLKTKSVDSANATYHKEDYNPLYLKRQYQKISNHLLIINF